MNDDLSVNQVNETQTTSKWGKIIAIIGLIVLFFNFFYTWSNSTMQNPIILNTSVNDVLFLILAIILIIIGGIFLKKQESISWSFNYHFILSLISLAIFFYWINTGVQNEPKAPQLAFITTTTILSLWFSGYSKVSLFAWLSWFILGIFLPILTFGFTWTSDTEVYFYVPLIFAITFSIFAILRLIDGLPASDVNPSVNKKIFLGGCIGSIIFIVITFTLFALVISSVH